MSQSILYFSDENHTFGVCLRIVNTSMICVSPSMGWLLQPVIEHNLAFADAAYSGLFKEYKFSSGYSLRESTWPQRISNLLTEQMS